MAKIAFIGLGNMGGPMAANLVKGQHQVMAFDLSATALDAAVAKGAKKVASAAEAVKGAEVVVTMLPAGKHVREVYEKDVLPNVAKGTLLIDCSTIDVDSARHVGQLAQQAGLEMVDAPVSGGVGGATAGTLTFMVGGSDAAFAKARPVLEKMGRNIVHTGGVGAGQAAKICNNMILGITMLAVSEGFLLGKRLGLDAQKLFDVVSTSSGSCWAEQLSPGARPGADLARQPRLPGGLHGRDDAQGPEARPGRRGGGRRRDPDGRRSRTALQPVRQCGQRHQGFLRHHPHAGWKVRVR